MKKFEYKVPENVLITELQEAADSYVCIELPKTIDKKKTKRTLTQEWFSVVMQMMSNKDREPVVKYYQNPRKHA